MVITLDHVSRWLKDRRPIVILVITLVLALFLEAGFYLGQHAAYSGMGAKPKSYKAMQQELISVQNALRSRDDELAIQRTRHEVDRQALELVRKEMAGQNEELAGLQEGLAFYRSLMSPGEIAPGLSLRSFELTAGDQPRQYAYRMVLQQEARKHDQLKGTLTAIVSGMADGKPVEYALGDISEDFDPGLQFRYFQSIQGSLILPGGFEPGTVRIRARTVKPNAFDVSQEYPWRLKERFTHVGN